MNTTSTAQQKKVAMEVAKAFRVTCDCCHADVNQVCEGGRMHESRIEKSNEIEGMATQ